MSMNNVSITTIIMLSNQLCEYTKSLEDELGKNNTISTSFHDAIKLFTSTLDIKPQSTLDIKPQQQMSTSNEKKNIPLPCMYENNSSNKSNQSFIFDRIKDNPYSTPFKHEDISGYDNFPEYHYSSVVDIDSNIEKLKKENESPIYYEQISDISLSTKYQSFNDKAPHVLDFPLKNGNNA